jgi:hypothetical protein
LRLVDSRLSITMHRPVPHDILVKTLEFLM